MQEILGGAASIAMVSPRSRRSRVKFLAENAS